MSGCGFARKTKETGTESKQVLEALVKCDGSCGSMDIALATGLDMKIISSRITTLRSKV